MIFQRFSTLNSEFCLLANVTTKEIEKLQTVKLMT